MPSLTTSAEPELTFNAHLGEGPVWDENEEKLYWVDILSAKLLVYDPSRKTNMEYDTGEHVGAVALRKPGGLLLALKTGIAFFDLESRKLTRILDPEPGLSGNRFNDGKCDPSGRFWAGTLSYKQVKGAGSLYILFPDLHAERKLREVTVPNGMAWNHDNNQFFFIDSPTGTIFTFDYDDKSGMISNRRTVRQIAEAEGSPDGMTIDEEDGLWVALYGSGKVIRIDPESGDTLHEIHLPVPNVTSCTFGGPGLDELYITTARENMSALDIKQAPLSGSLFKAKVPCKGLPVSRFSG